MSFLLNLFRYERPPDDETVLASLARDIARQQTLLVDLRARERAVSKRITLYPLAAWLVYLGVWYFGFVSGGSAGRVKPKAVRVLPVFMGPIVILFIRRMVRTWYARKGEAENKTLQTLLNAQHAKVDDIKKKTNFYETYDLLSRYGGSFSGLPSPSGAGNANGGGEGGESVSMPNAPQRTGQVQRGGPRLSMLSAAPPSSTFAAHQQKQYHIRGWFDLLTDVLVGPGDSPQVDKKKPEYALICAKCHSHNGLVPEGGVQFTCSTCGHFNPSPQRRGLVRGAASPSSQPFALSPTSPSPRSPLSISHGQASQGRRGAEAPVPVSSAGSAGSGREVQAQAQALPRRRGAQTQPLPQRREAQTQVVLRRRDVQSQVLPRRRSARGAAGGGEEEMKVDS